MKKLLKGLYVIFAMVALYMPAKAQTVDQSIDKFTGDTISTTAPDTLVGKKIIDKKGRVQLAISELEFFVGKISKKSRTTSIIYFKFTPRSVISISNTDSILLKTSSKEIISLPWSGLTKVFTSLEPCRFNSILTKERTLALKSAEITAIRIKTSDGYYDFDIPDEKKSQISKHLTTLNL